MPKALFFNVPAHGHVNPSLPLVSELVHRGHQITYVITENYRAQVEAAGAVYQPYATLQDDYFEVRELSGLRPQRVAYELITTAGEILPELLEIARRTQPDYVMNDGMCPWGLLVARILGVPAVTSLSLMVIGSPRSMMNLTTLRIIVPMLMRDFDKGLEANRRSRALGTQYNIPPLGPMSILNAMGDISISYTSSYFQPYASTVPDTVRFVGRTMSEASSDDSFSFDKVQARRLIYVSLGTVNNDNAGFFKTCIEAFGSSSDFVIITTGKRISPESFGALPDNIAVYSWVPQIEVLKRTALFITHGGMGSVHDGLYFGIPLLLIPQQDEQMFTALRVAELGAGLMLKKTQVSAETLRDNAARLLTDPRYKTEAIRVGDTFRAAGGAPRAADEVEALLRKRSGSKLQ